MKQIEQIHVSDLFIFLNILKFYSIYLMHQVGSYIFFWEI